MKNIIATSAFCLLLFTACISLSATQEDLASQYGRGLRDIMFSEICVAKILGTGTTDAKALGNKFAAHYQSLGSTTLMSVMGLVVGEAGNFEKNFNPDTCKQVLPNGIAIRDALGMPSDLYRKTLEKLSGNAQSPANGTGAVSGNNTLIYNYAEDGLSGELSLTRKNAGVWTLSLMTANSSNGATCDVTIDCQENNGVFLCHDPEEDGDIIIRKTGTDSIDLKTTSSFSYCCGNGGYFTGKYNKVR